jgi:hypothetical protein
MSVTVIENDASSVPAVRSSATVLGKFGRLVDTVVGSPWRWFALTCALLLISGAVRSWRDSQFSSIARESEACPFPLNELPAVLGHWHAVEGSESHLDPETARIAGSSDHMIRVYADDKTGETVSVLVLYGLARSVFSHSPEICYPAAGYTPVGVSPVDHAVPYAESAVPARYRSSYFVQRIAGVSQFVEVVCSFRHNNAWVPDVSNRWKMFRSHPGMFKVQLHHPCVGISSDVTETESLLKAIIQAIETRLAAKPAVTGQDSAPK